ncbi:MAG: O-unit flippase-like protein [Flavobacterium sp.]
MKIGKADLVWSYLAQILRFGSNLFILPIVLRTLIPEELAIWYLFASISSLVMLIDFGFSSTIIRNVTYVFAGATQLQKEGIVEDSTDMNGEVNESFLSRVIFSIKFIYTILSFVGFILLSTLGTYYLYTVIKSETLLFQHNVWIAWSIFVIATVTVIYYLYLTTLLTGRGYIKHAQKAQIVYNGSFIIIAYLGLFFGYGLIAIAIALLISCIIERLFLVHYFYDSWIRKIIKSNKATFDQKKDIITVIWFNAKKMGFVSIGSFFINKMGQFFVTSFFSLKIAAQYGLTLQIVSFVSSASLIYFNTVYPKMIYNFYKGKLDVVKKEWSLSLVLILLFFLLSTIVTLMLGEFVFEAINSKTIMLPSALISVIMLVNFFEIQHSIAANIMTFSNKIPFLYPSLLSGFSIVIITYLVLSFIGANVWYMILIQLLVQLSYNNWKWPYEASKILKTTYVEIVKNGFSNLFLLIKSFKWKY